MQVTASPVRRKRSFGLQDPLQIQRSKRVGQMLFQPRCQVVEEPIGLRRDPDSQSWVNWIATARFTLGRQGAARKPPKISGRDPLCFELDCRPRHTETLAAAPTAARSAAVQFRRTVDTSKPTNMGVLSLAELFQNPRNLYALIAVVGSTRCRTRLLEPATAVVQRYDVPTLVEDRRPRRAG